MALQGLNMGKYQRALEETSQTTLNRLAGNAFSLHCFTVGFLAALSTLPISWFELNTAKHPGPWDFAVECKPSGYTWLSQTPSPQK